MKGYVVCMYQYCLIEACQGSMSTDESIVAVESVCLHVFFSSGMSFCRVFDKQMTAFQLLRKQLAWGHDPTNSLQSSWDRQGCGPPIPTYPVMGNPYISLI